MNQGARSGGTHGSTIATTAKAVAGIVAVVAGLAAYFNTPSGERTCMSAARRSVSIPFFCAESVKPVELDDATAFLDRFIGRAGASTPSNAWGMLSTEVQAETPLERFEAAWKPVHWAERMGSIERGEAFNSFVVKYRTYSGGEGGYAATKGTVTDRHVTVVLRRTDPYSEIEPGTGLALEITQLGAASRDAVQDVSFVPVRLTRTVTPVERPMTGAQTTAPQPASTLAAYCMVQRDDTDPSSTWVRTGLGWLSVDGAAVQVDSAPPSCDSHHVSGG